MIRLVCPTDPRHGAVMPVPLGWYCPHTAHDGRLRLHPLGEAPATRHTFTTAEVEAGGLAARATAQQEAPASERAPSLEPSVPVAVTAARVPTGASLPASDAPHRATTRAHSR